MGTYVFEAPYERLLPAVSPFRVSKRRTLPIVADIGHSSSELVNGYTQEQVIFAVGLFPVEQGQHCTMPLERDGPQVVNECCVNLREQ